MATATTMIITAIIAYKPSLPTDGKVVSIGNGVLDGPVAFEAGFCCIVVVKVEVTDTGIVVVEDPGVMVFPEDSGTPYISRSTLCSTGRYEIFIIFA